MIKKLNQKKMIRTYPKVYSRGQGDASSGMDGEEMRWWGVLQIPTRVGWMSRIFLLDDC